MTPGDLDDAERTARLEALQIRFRTTLPQRITAILEGVEAVRVGPWPGEKGDQLLADVHSLAGSAGLFGHEGLGEAAGAVERVLVALERRKTATAVDISMLREAGQRLKTAHAQCTSS